MNDSLSRRRRRTKLIRTRVVAGAVALFVAVFGGITAQLAAGHDPALSKSTTATTTTKSATTTAAQPSTTTATTTQQKQDTPLAPVTTKQS
ncbi:MAG TPA: hypothetical protein VGC98_05515 [Thermoleophilaceae bacterium]|jgi:hypothetical protein